MKAGELSDARKAFVLRQAEDGVPIDDVCREAGISQAMFHAWRKERAGPLPGETPDFTLVAGLSSSGKSTWLEAQEAGPVVIPFEFGNDLSKLPAGALVHYNTLRYADNDAAHLGRDFEADPFLAAVLARSGRFDAVYIAAPPAELARRIARRRTVERGTGVYPRKGVARAIAALDQHAFHAAWLELMGRHARRLTLLLSDPEGFRETTREDLLAAMAGGGAAARGGRLGRALSRLIGR